jgi:hypothetical protein
MSQTKNQFFYTRVENDKTFIDSFNINRVLRTIQVADNEIAVILDDGHEESRIVNIDRKKNVPIKERGYYFSQIMLKGEDVERFRELSKIN